MYLPRSSRTLQTPKTKINKIKRPKAKAKMLNTNFSTVSENILSDGSPSSRESTRVQSVATGVNENWKSLTSGEQQIILRQPSSRKVDTKPKFDVESVNDKKSQLKYTPKEDGLMLLKSRLNRMRKIFYAHHKKPRKPQSSFMNFAEDRNLLGRNSVKEAGSLWKMLPEEEKQVYNAVHGKLLIQYFKQKMEWDKRMQENGFYMFCGGYDTADIQKKQYIAVLDFFAKDDNIYILTKEEHKNLIHRWKANKSLPLFTDNKRQR